MSTGAKDKSKLMGNKKAVKHGFYAVGLLPGEGELYEKVNIGDLEEEIRMGKIRLRRLYGAQAQWLRQKAEGREELELVEAELNGVAVEGGDQRLAGRIKRIRRKHDFEAEIRAAERGLSSLMIRSAQLKELSKGDGDMDALRAAIRKDLGIWSADNESGGKNDGD
jgi:hypothetical protein